MPFMSAYKHLDNLCKDCNQVGISGYIADMDEQFSAGYRVPGWDDDYDKLKHYRWIRNQIAHEDYADEENMCQAEDTEWLEKFYTRIINQTDPLALYHKITVTDQEQADSICKQRGSSSSLSQNSSNADNGRRNLRHTANSQKKSHFLRPFLYIMIALALLIIAILLGFIF